MAMGSGLLRRDAGTDIDEEEKKEESDDREQPMALLDWALNQHEESRARCTAEHPRLDRTEPAQLIRQSCAVITAAHVGQGKGILTEVHHLRARRAVCAFRQARTPGGVGGVANVMHRAREHGAM